ncbi:uncharacterized protein LOC120136038 [Hibiscus syriacus]|uniref:uncharacterized protein LOC120136038 n=1 Tax=Hibiscus syriacus TaxID=106335 RepID=UPI001924B174|nr:uncharacterized protein LOC120136038 [Hibiscus syriacus]
MEEPKAAPNPPTATANAAAPTPQPPPTVPEQPASKKRPLENSNDQYQNSPYCKIRLFLKDLRLISSRFFECLIFKIARPPMKSKKRQHLLELYKQMLASIEKSKQCTRRPDTSS